MLPETQSAIVVPSAKAPFTITTVPVLTPGKGEVLVKVEAVGLNPMDPFRRAMDMLIDAYPVIMGSSIAGVVMQVGDGVEGWKTGDEVLSGGMGGGYQQYAVLDAALLIRKPSNVSFDDATTYPVTWTTAANGLFAPAPIGLGLNPTFVWEKLHAGKSAFVLGASTSVGQHAIQLLKFIGFTRIVAYASSKHAHYLASLGATDIIAREDTALPALPAHALFSQLGKIDVVFDGLFATAPGAASSLDIAHAIVNSAGQIVTVNPRTILSGEAGNVQIVRVFGYYVAAGGGTPDHAKFGEYIKENLPKLMEAGEIKPNRVEVLPGGLEGIVKGLDRWFIAGEGGVSGVKLVGHPQEGL
ncbi:GroES-like protein [Mycena kentingensis (nom. inval.)]|nr:GroES-like protein [Mycena kentingensis (nom. inval.)]